MNIVAQINTIDFDEIERISSNDLTSLARKIDDERIYPEEIVRAYGAAGAFGSHVGGLDGNVDLTHAITAMARASEVCLSTGFCVWCQDTLAWYISSSDNDFLKAEVLPKVAKGQALGGTGMSNPMKAMGEIERMRLKGERVEGGYKVKGVLPWVSNLVEDGYFGTVFDVEVEGEDKPKRVMVIVHAAWDGISLRLDHEFVAMGGTATCNVQFRDVFVPDEYLLSDPAEPFVKRIRAGFTLLQCGMAAGIIKNCIDLMKQVQGPLGHVNKYLEKQPEDIEAEYEALVADVLEMAGQDVEAISHEIFDRTRHRRGSKNFQAVLERIGRAGDIASKARESLMSLNRAVTFLGLAAPNVGGKHEKRNRLKTMARDLQSLADYASFVSGKVTFLLDATLGMLSIEQNNIIKIFWVAAMIFLPPTLVGTIYGMNFEFMPELDWWFGYPFAIFVMVVSAVIPYIFFKRKGWL